MFLAFIQVVIVRIGGRPFEGLRRVSAPTGTMVVVVRIGGRPFEGLRLEENTNNDCYQYVSE